MFSTKSFLISALWAILLLLGVQAQDIPFLVDGAFQGATASTTDYNAGGSITVNGLTITVPKNLMVQFPAAFIPFKNFVAGAGAFSGYETSVIGNIVGGVHIAAQVSISQFFTTTAMGFVDTVSFDGKIKLQNGQTLIINDPNGVYSVGYTAQPFFTADDQNPSITAFSGFPLCVPRNATDPLCPSNNRPITSTGTKQGTVRAPDPLVMAPIVPGDFVEYSGFINGQGQVIVYNLVASNVQLTTTGAPTYIRMEDALIGVFTADQNNQEIAQSKFVGYTSDGAANVNPLTIYAMDIDPCTGESTDRQIAGTNLIAGGARNKFEYRNKFTQANAYTREYHIFAGTGTVLTKNGILAGQFVMPVSEWIQPEMTTPGLNPFPHDFSGYSFLTKGLGRDKDGNLFGPLSPFPQSGVATFDTSTCPPPPPPPSSTTSSAVSSATPAPTPSVFPDVVTIQTAQWISSGGGTLTVACRSNSTNNAAVNMKLSYSGTKSGTTTGLGMTAGANGLWNFNSVKIKQPTQVTCKSGLGGTATVNI